MTPGRGRGVSEDTSSDHRHLFVLSARGDDQLGARDPGPLLPTLGTGLRVWPRPPRPLRQLGWWKAPRKRLRAAARICPSRPSQELVDHPQEHVGAGRRGLLGIRAWPSRRQGSVWPEACGQTNRKGPLPRAPPATPSLRSQEPGAQSPRSAHTRAHGPPAHQPVGRASSRPPSLAVAGGGGGLSEAPDRNRRRRGHSLCPGGGGEQVSSEPVPPPPQPPGALRGCPAPTGACCRGQQCCPGHCCSAASAAGSPCTAG